MPPLNPQMQAMMPSGMQGGGTNLWSIILNIAFGFVAGLMVFMGVPHVLAYGSQLASEIMKQVGYGQQMGGFGLAASAAPYIVIAPIAGLVVKELSSVRSLKSFGYFAAAVLVGFAIAFATQGYFASVMVASGA